MNWLLLRLLAFLLPGIDDLDPADPADPADPDEPADPADPDEPADPADPADPEDPADPADPDDEPAPRETRAQRQFRELRERAQRSEAATEALRAELEAARRAPAPSAQPDPEQVLFQQEEEALRNPETSDWQKYAINSARQARAANAASRQALVRAEDMGDRADFAELASEQPKLYAAYKGPLEERLKKIRAGGGNISRRNLLTVMLGEDTLAGKLKVAPGKAPKAPAPRGAPRSDVPVRRDGGLSDAEKRAARLENVRI